MKKKLIPIDLLVPIEDVLGDNQDVVANKREDNCYYSIYDLDPDSGFYFKVIIDWKKIGSFASVKQGTIYWQQFPLSHNNIVAGKGFLKREDIVPTLKEWIKVIRTFNEIESVYDDPFLKTYQKHYYNSFKIVDEDADYAPFDPDQQDAVIEYLEYVEQKLIGYNEDNEGNTEILDELISETRQAVKEMPISTKEKALSNLSTIWAKVYKWNRNVAKEIVAKAKEQLMKELISKGISYIPEVAAKLNKLPEHIDKAF